MDCFKMCMLGSILLLGAFKSLKSQMDPEIYGGAPLRSLVAHLLWEQAVWGSNPSAPTNFFLRTPVPAIGLPSAHAKHVEAERRNCGIISSHGY